MAPLACPSRECKDGNGIVRKAEIPMSGGGVRFMLDACAALGELRSVGIVKDFA
jgi:hypothetical protein